MLRILSARALGLAVLVTASACTAGKSESELPDGGHDFSDASAPDEPSQDERGDAAVSDDRSCGDKPDGHEEQRARFERALVDAGETCTAEVQVRTCHDGKWSEWSGQFEAATCEVQGRRSCGAVAHGERATQVRYEQAEVPFGSECVAEQQAATCHDGVLGEFDGTFTFATCIVEEPADCEGGTHGSERTQERYESASVPFGSECKAEVQRSTCENGTWSDYEGTFTFETCVVEPADCSNGEHGAVITRERFEHASVPFDQECKVETQTSTCLNGTWTDYTGTFKAETCVVAPPRDCEPGFAHGAQRTETFYEAASVPYGAECKSQLQTSTCYDGTWGAFEGPYKFSQCAPLPPASCGNTPHGGTVTRRRYERWFVQPGEPCKSELQTSTCNNGRFGRWTGSFREAECQVIGSCYDPDTREVIEPFAYQTRTMYKDAFPEGACSSEQQQRKCEPPSELIVGVPGVFGRWSGTYDKMGCASLAESQPVEFACRLVVGEVSTCREWSALSAEEQDRMYCAGAPGDTKRSCPTGGTAAGKCEEAAEEGGTLTTYYYTPVHAARAKAECGAPKVWTDL